MHDANIADQGIRVLPVRCLFVRLDHVPYVEKCGHYGAQSFHLDTGLRVSDDMGSDPDADFRDFRLDSNIVERKWVAERQQLGSQLGPQEASYMG